MTKNSPLRRLSVALKLRQAFDPPQPVTSADAPSISQFLRAAKDSFLRDVKEDPAKAAGQWTVVMGNEAGDLDSIASSIAYAWVLSEVKKIPAIPLVQVQHDDLNLRPENIYAFKLAGLTESLEELLTSSDVSEFKPFPSQKFALVDHNRLGSTFSLDNPTAEVVSVIDHHEDEKLYLNASPRIIAPCGSCASHVATQFPPEPLPDLALLLLTAILIDTDGLKPGGKAVQTDRDSALFLAPKSSIANSIPPLSALSPIDHPNPDALYEAQAIKDLTKALRDRKSDVSNLSGFDLLRRDYKEYSHTLAWAAGSPSIKVGLSTVVSGLKTWGTDGKLEQAAVRWMTERKITALGICTSFRQTKKIGKKNDKGKHKREQAWILLTEPELAGIASEGLTTDVIAKRLFTGLEANESLQLKKYKKFSKLEKGSKLPPGSRAKAYKQENVDASRKEIAPLLKNILEGDAGAKGGQQD